MTNKTMTMTTQMEDQSGAVVAAEGAQAERISFAGALLGFMLTTTLTTSIMVLLSQG
jgi:hypothetical protein